MFYSAEGNDEETPQLPRVTVITAYSKGFACSAGPGTVYLFERTDDKDNYRKTREIRVTEFISPNYNNHSSELYNANLSTFCTNRLFIKSFLIMSLPLFLYLCVCINVTVLGVHVYVCVCSCMCSIQIPPDQCSHEPSHAEQQQIVSLVISPSEETVVTSTDRGQLYSITLSSAEMSKGEQVQFEFLSHSFHSGSITGLSICIRKPIIATCSLDQSVRIWNVETK